MRPNTHTHTHTEQVVRRPESGRLGLTGRRAEQLVSHAPDGAGVPALTPPPKPLRWGRPTQRLVLEEVAPTPWECSCCSRAPKRGSPVNSCSFVAVRCS